MPNALDRPALDVIERVRSVIHSALDDGRGVAVMKLRDLLPNEADEDFLNGDAEEAGPVLKHVAYIVGASGATYWPHLPLWADHPVVLVLATRFRPGEREQPLAALLHAMTSFHRSPWPELDARAEDVAAMARKLIRRR